MVLECLMRSFLSFPLFIFYVCMVYICEHIFACVWPWICVGVHVCAHGEVQDGCWESSLINLPPSFWDRDSQSNPEIANMSNCPTELYSSTQHGLESTEGLPPSDWPVSSSVWDCLWSCNPRHHGCVIQLSPHMMRVCSMQVAWMICSIYI